MTTLTSPHDLLAAIPFLIGYHPDRSLVLVSLKNETIGMAMRVDLPSDIAPESYDLLASHFSARRSGRAHLSLPIAVNQRAMLKAPSSIHLLLSYAQV